MDKSKCLTDILETIISIYPNLEKGRFSIACSGEYGNYLARKLIELIATPHTWRLQYDYKSFCILVAPEWYVQDPCFEIGIYRRDYP